MCHFSSSPSLPCTRLHAHSLEGAKQTARVALALLDWPTLPATKQENKSALVFWPLFWPDNWKGGTEGPTFVVVLPTGTSVTSDCGIQGGAAQC